MAAAAIADGADLIIAAGGDGTVSEVVDGMANSPVPLAILPGGTANVLAHEVGLRRSVQGAARQIGECVPSRVSLGKIETADGEARHFLLMAGAGFDAEIIRDLDPGLKGHFGKLSYFLGGLGHLGRGLRELEAVSDGRRQRCSFALISKVRNYGGDFEIAQEVRLQDDSFEVVLFEGRNSWRYLRYLAGVATRQLGRTPGVHSFRAEKVVVRPIDKDVYLQADGELVGKLPATISIVPDALSLLLPARGRVNGGMG